MKPDFGKRVEQYKERRKKHNRKELRIIKVIAETVRKILQNNSKRLTTEDLNDICLKVYNKVDSIKRVRVYNMINQPEIKEKIEDSLIQAYINKGIKPLEKVIDLTDKAESVAKSTSDYMQIAKHYQEVAKLAPNTTIKQVERVNYNELMEETGRTVTREVSVSTASIQDNQNNADKPQEDTTFTKSSEDPKNAE